MRISDWSSDVCSSDLGRPPAARWRALTPTPACAVHSARWRASCPIFWASAATCWATPSAPALRLASSRVRYSAPGSDGGGASNSAGSKGPGIGGATLQGPDPHRLLGLTTHDTAHHVLAVGSPLRVFHC